MVSATTTMFIRRIFLVIACLPLATTLLLAGWIQWKSSRDSGAPIRYENLNKIVAGMTRQQVIDLLGCEPGFHGRRTAYFTECACAGMGQTALQWIGTRGTIVVVFAWKDNTVNDKWYYPAGDE